MRKKPHEVATIYHFNAANDNDYDTSTEFWFCRFGPDLLTLEEGCRDE